MSDDAFIDPAVYGEDFKLWKEEHKHDAPIPIEGKPRHSGAAHASSKAAAARDAHIKGMTQAEKLLARVAGLLKATPNCGVVVLYFAVQDGQPVWWFVSDTERLEGFKIDAPAVGVADQENVV
jgi:hypothetical protein